MTTDGRRWSVAFRAHSWDDARSIAEQFQATVDGVIEDEFTADTLERVAPAQHLAGWEFRDERFLKSGEAKPGDIRQRFDELEATFPGWMNINIGDAISGFLACGGRTFEVIEVSHRSYLDVGRVTRVVAVAPCAP